MSDSVWISFFFNLLALLLPTISTITGDGRACGKAGGDRVRGQDRITNIYLIPAILWYFMSGQPTPRSKREQEISVNGIEGLSPGERQRLEESIVIRPKTKTRQYYGFMGITKYDEKLIIELEHDWEESGRD